MLTVDLTADDSDSSVSDQKDLDPGLDGIDNDNDNDDDVKDPDYDACADDGEVDDDEEDNDGIDENLPSNCNSKDASNKKIFGKSSAQPKTSQHTTPQALPKHKKNPLVYRNPTDTPPGEWTDAEIKALVAGVVKHEKGNWVTIKQDPSFALALVRRTTTSMASKYYQICKRRENERKRARKKAEREREREERKKLPRKKPRARIAWTTEEDAALLNFVKMYGQQWAKIKSENVIKNPPPINVNRTRAGLFNRYKCLIEHKKRNEEAGHVKWTDKLDKKLLVLAAVHEQDWRIVADEFFAEARNEKAKTSEDEAAEKQCLQARYSELLDAVVHKDDTKPSSKVATKTATTTAEVAP